MTSRGIRCLWWEGLFAGSCCYLVIIRHQSVTAKAACYISSLVTSNLKFLPVPLINQNLLALHPKGCKMCPPLLTHSLRGQGGSSRHGLKSPIPCHNTAPRTFTELVTPKKTMQREQVRVLILVGKRAELV